MLDKFIVFRTFIALAALLLLFGYILAACIRGVFIKEAVPYIVITMLLCIAVVVGQLLFFYL